MPSASVGQLFPGAVGPESVLGKVLMLPASKDCVVGKELDWFTSNITAGTSQLHPLEPCGTLYLPESHFHIYYFFS
jgi:hypothetical protein